MYPRHLLVVLAFAALFSACATRVPLNTPVPFAVHGKVITEDGALVSGAYVSLSEEHSRLFPLVIAPPRKLGEDTTRSDGSFRIVVRTPLQSQTLNLFVLGRTYVLPGTEHTLYNAKDDSRYTMMVRVNRPNILRVRRGFVPGNPDRSNIVVVQELPSF